MKSKIRISALILLGTIASLLISALPIFADTVIKKNGRRFDGKILEDNEDWIIIETKFGIATIDREDIKKVTYGDTEPADSGKTAPAKKRGYEERLAEAGKKNTAEAWAALGRWCRKNKRKAEADKAFRKAIELDPDNADARKALGYEKIDGKWMTGEEAEAAGYIKVGKKWVTKEDLEEAERKRIEEQIKQAEERRKQREKELQGVPWKQRFKHTSPHYELHCNVTPKVTGTYVRVMEALFNKYMKIFAALKPKQRTRCKVYIHRTAREFQQINHKGPGTGGYYSSGEHALYCYHGDFGMTGSTLTVLAHEGCHQFQHMFMGARMSSSPIWLLEGMAVIFESANINPRKGTVDLVGLNPDRARRLKSMMKRGRHVTLQQMLDTSQRGFNASHYCTAGAFTWWLLKDSKKKKYKKLYEKYLLDILEGRGGMRRRGGGLGGDGGSFARMAEDTIGKTIAELEEEWKDYVLKLEIPKNGKFVGDKFISHLYGFEVAKPGKDWNALEEKELSQAQALCWEHKETEARFSIYVLRHGVSMSPERDLATFEQDTPRKRDVTDFRLFHKKKTFVGGYEAAEFFYQLRKPRSTWNTKLLKNRRIIVYGDSYVYILIASCTAEKWEENAPDFDKIRDSFLVSAG